MPEDCSYSEERLMWGSTNSLWRFSLLISVMLLDLLHCIQDNWILCMVIYSNLFQIIWCGMLLNKAVTCHTSQITICPLLCKYFDLGEIFRPISLNISQRYFLFGHLTYLWSSGCRVKHLDPDLSLKHSRVPRSPMNMWDEQRVTETHL